MTFIACFLGEYAENMIDQILFNVESVFDIRSFVRCHVHFGFGLRSGSIGVKNARSVLDKNRNETSLAASLGLVEVVNTVHADEINILVGKQTTHGVPIAAPVLEFDVGRVNFVIAAGFAAAAAACFSTVLADCFSSVLTLMHDSPAHFLKNCPCVRHIEREHATSGRVAGAINDNFACTAGTAAAHATSILETNVLDLIPTKHFRFSGQNSGLDGDLFTGDGVLRVGPDSVAPEGSRALVPNAHVKGSRSRRGSGHQK